MKRRLVLISVFFLFSISGIAQNIQLHYDFGKANDNGVNRDREYFTTTIEMFKPDSLGSTFFFVDLDYNDENGMSFAYWEIYRKFTVPKVNFLALEIGFEDGMFIPAAWLVGPSVSFKLANFDISTSVFYRAERHAKTADFQFTGVWFSNFFNNKLTFSGFVDVWTADDFNDVGEREGKRTVFLTEPQLWFNATKWLALGGEVELSKNFFTFDGDIEIMPTLAVKWTF